MCELGRGVKEEVLLVLAEQDAPTHLDLGLFLGQRAVSRIIHPVVLSPVYQSRLLDANDTGRRLIRGTLDTSRRVKSAVCDTIHGPGLQATVAVLLQL